MTKPITAAELDALRDEELSKRLDAFFGRDA
jgi:hypothetical protein